MQYDVRILSSSYIREEHVVIELYGKTKEGKSITIRVYNFKPYFYLFSQDEKLIEELNREKSVLNVEKTELFYEGEFRKFLKITIKHPWEVPDFRERYKTKFGVKSFAADIPFTQRFIYDYDLSSCIRVFCEDEKEEIKKRYTTELVVKAKNFENIADFKPPLKILSFDIENSLREDKIFTICCVVKDKEQTRTYCISTGEEIQLNNFAEKIFGNEREVIENFIEIIRKEDPDVLTGYNIDGYDIPLLEKRAKANGIENLNIGRDFSPIKPMGTSRFWKLHGRIIADTWMSAKNELRPKKETLNFIAKLVLNEEKDDVNPRKIDEEWKNNKEKVIKYCVKDSELALRILEKIAVLEKSMDLASVSKLPMDEVFNGRTSTLIDSILIRSADKNRIAVLNTRREKEDEREQIEGGYVHAIEPGLYHWVCVFDFKSMYPSVIISNNICFTTLNKNGKIIAPDGRAKFLAKEEREGLLPRILIQLMKDRENTKQKMKNAKTDEEKRYYDGLQSAIKTLMNAFYGVFASNFYRFTNKDIGSAITGFSRKNIMNIIEILTRENLKVIYSDTDSIFLQSPYENLQETIKFAETISQRFSKDVISFEFDKVLKSFFSHGKKKRYVGKVVYPKEEILVRGYEMRRTDAFDLQSESLMQIFEEVLNDKVENAINLSKNIIADVLSGKVAIEKLVISKTAKDESYYKSAESQMHVMAVRKLRELGHEFTSGMKVSFIVVNSQRSPMLVEPYIDGQEFTHKPDFKYYAERVAESLARITEVFGWNGESLIRGVKGAQQKGLLSFEGEKIEEKKENEVGEEDIINRKKGPMKFEKNENGFDREDEIVNIENEEKNMREVKKDEKKKKGRLEDFL